MAPLRDGTAGTGYDSTKNIHTLEGAAAAFRAIFPDEPPGSLLDVGCGPGTWMRAALEAGVKQVRGMDMYALETGELHVDPELITVTDFQGSWRIAQDFDVIICLEVVEHLPESVADQFIENLCAHTKRIIFSAANKWQRGQNHLNCQWPAYWQEKFNRNRFACYDTLRWRIWDIPCIEPWYRQNTFLAEHDPDAAGAEKRIPSVVHPDYMVNACEYWRMSHETLIVSVARRIDQVLRKLLFRESIGKQDPKLPGGSP